MKICCYCGKPAQRFVIVKKHPIVGAIVAHIGCGPVRRNIRSNVQNIRLVVK